MLLRLLDLSYLIFWELYSLQPRCSCLNLLTSPGQALNATSSMAQAASSSTNFANSCQVRDFTWGFSWIPSLAGKNIGVTRKWQHGCLQKKREIHRSARCQWQKYDLSSHLKKKLRVQVGEDIICSLIYMISHCFQLLFPAGVGSTWRCSNVSNYHDSAPLCIGQTWAASFARLVTLPYVPSWHIR